MNKLNKIQELYNLVKSIPEDQWCINKLQDDEGRCCVSGHYNKSKTGDPWVFTVEGFEWRFLNEYYLTRYNSLPAHYMSALVAANNNKLPEYQQEKIKDRVMAFLEDCLEIEKNN